MGGKSKPQQGAITSQSGPWSGIQPYLGNIYAEAQDLYNRNPARTAGYNQDFATGRRLLTDTAEGNYLTGGQGFNEALQAATNKIIPQVDSRFAMGGRFGSGLARTAEAGAIGDAFSNLYNQERNRQQQAQTTLPQLAEMQRTVEQNRLDDPARSLSRYADILSRLNANQSTGYSQPTYGGSTASGILGAGIGGLSLLSSLGYL